jgi:hypothetical protein
VCHASLAHACDRRDGALEAHFEQNEYGEAVKEMASLPEERGHDIAYASRDECVSGTRYDEDLQTSSPRLCFTSMRQKGSFWNFSRFR